MQRRRFLEYMGLAGLVVSPFGACASKTAALIPVEPTKTTEEAWTSFAHINARGTPFEIGKTVGTETRHLIEASMADRAEWFDDLKRFALADRANRIDGFVKAIGHYLPECLEELKGLAEGSGIPLDDILILNFKPELGTLKEQIEGDACSTFHLISNSQNLLLHNEDGHEAYHRRLFVLHATPNDAPAFVSLVYPGMISGSVPFMNDAGLFMSTNFIGVKDVNVEGVPRYVLGRGVLYKKTIEQAVELVTKTVKDRAYSFHLNLGSLKEKRLVAVDTAPNDFDVQETSGLFLQTNHFVLPKTKVLEQPIYTPGGSTDSRYKTLSRLMMTLPAPDQVTRDQLLDLLSSHEAVNQPYSPCRHPTENSSSRTLATAVFDINLGTFSVCEGNPCKRRITKLEI